MAKRLLDCTTSDFKSFSKNDIIESIAKSEGRVLMCETIGITMPLLVDVTNAEFACAMGADMLLLNLFDVNEPLIRALDCPKDEVIREIKRLTGRLTGINLEPVNEDLAANNADIWKVSPGRKATVENAVMAMEMGADFIMLTGNPGSGVTNECITDSLSKIRKAVGHKVVLICGKMHGSGVTDEPVISNDDVLSFIEAGADILAFPCPGTVPGVNVEFASELVSLCHKHKKLAMTTIGTSQEGADKETIKQLALMAKMTGADIHHLGDSGYIGMCLPENIMAYSIAIRGIRHTYHRMAVSVNR